MKSGKGVAIDKDACVGCGVCVSLCPQQILAIDDEGKCVVTDETRCDHLAGCERACPVKAIKIGGR